MKFKLYIHETIETTTPDDVTQACAAHIVNMHENHGFIKLENNLKKLTLILFQFQSTYLKKEVPVHYKESIQHENIALKQKKQAVRTEAQIKRKKNSRRRFLIYFRDMPLGGI